MSPSSVVDHEHGSVGGGNRVDGACGDTQKHRPGTGFDLLELG